jgi:hypothetical protein
MCYTVTCRECGKTKWAGCGQHAQEVMRAVPKNERCEGHEQQPGLLARLFRR